MRIRMSFTLPEASDLRAFVDHFAESSVYWGNHAQFTKRIERVRHKINAAIDAAIEQPKPPASVRKEPRT